MCRWINVYIIRTREAYSPGFVRRLVRPFMDVAGAFKNRALIAAKLAHSGQPDMVPLYVCKELWGVIMIYEPPCETHFCIGWFCYSCK